MSFLPGSHKTAPVCQRLVRKAGDAGTEMVENDGSKFPPGAEYGLEGPDEAGQYVPGEVKAGDCRFLRKDETQPDTDDEAVVLIHGNLLHKSEKKYADDHSYYHDLH